MTEMPIQTNRCPTVLLEDSPADEDAFGPHQRIANAILDLIQSHEQAGGKAIGLEGGWGSGKSTVVRFVREALLDDDGYCVISFDAWAHEGDPLRRSYLETIVNSLTDRGWLKKSSWKNRLQELARRRKTTKSRIVTKPTSLGILLAISLFLVPVGTTLLSALLREGPMPFLGAFLIDALTQGQSAMIRMLVFGFAATCAGAPFIILIYNFFRVLILKIRGKSTTGEWAFVVKGTTETTRTLSIETPDPTSLEFDKYFADAMNEAFISNPQRRVLLIIDNIDRLEHESAAAIWSTLQTFLQERNFSDHIWFRQIWILVPYEPEGLHRLWRSGTLNNASGTSVDDQAKEVRRITASFLDKSFQIRFNVPPPVLSDWKLYVQDLVKVALPCYTEEEAYGLYRVYEYWRVENSIGPPTPRELKLFVNQVGVIHRQWQHAYSSKHIGYFVLWSRNNPRAVESLIANPPADSTVSFLGDDLVKNLAGLAFNVPPKKGMELLLRDPIGKSIFDGNAERLRTLEEQHKDGFWPVLDLVLAEQVAIDDVTKLAQAALCIDHSGLLAEVDMLEANSIKAHLALTAMKVSTWRPLNKNVTDGIVALCQIVPSIELAQCLEKGLEATLELEAEESHTREDGELAVSAVRVLAALEKMGLERDAKSQLVLPLIPVEWTHACIELLQVDEYAQCFGKIVPDHTGEELANFIKSALEEGEFFIGHIRTIEVTKQTQLHVDWSPVVDAIERQLDPTITSSNEELTDLLSALKVLQKISRDDIQAVLRRVVTAGYILQHIKDISPTDEPELYATCLSLQLQHDPKLKPTQSAAAAASGIQSINADLANNDNKLASQLVTEFRDEQCLDSIFSVIKARGVADPLMKECVVSVANSENPHSLFSGNVVLKNWQTIQDALEEKLDGGGNDLFESLLDRLTASTTFLGELLRASDGFSTEDAELYWRLLVNGGHRDKAFLTWCQYGLENLNKDDWMADFNGSFECVWLAINLADYGAAPKLETPLSDALESHADDLMAGNKVPEEAVLKKWGNLLTQLNEDVLNVLLSRILNKAASQDGKIDEVFFVTYGDQIARDEVIRNNGETIAKLLSPILRERNAAGLRVIEALWESDTKVLDSLSSTHIGEFRSRLKDDYSTPQEDDAQPIIDSIAKKLRVRRRNKKSDPDSAEATP